MPSPPPAPYEMETPVGMNAIRRSGGKSKRKSHHRGTEATEKVRNGGRFELTALAPLGERVDRNRRFHQPGRDG